MNLLFTEEDGFYSGEVPGSGVKELTEFPPIKTESENKCEPNPCHNGGVCVENFNFIDGYKCQCADDFGGITCNGKSLKLCTIHAQNHKGDKKRLVSCFGIFMKSFHFLQTIDVGLQIHWYILD